MQSYLRKPIFYSFVFMEILTVLTELQVNIMMYLAPFLTTTGYPQPTQEYEYDIAKLNGERHGGQREAGGGVAGRALVPVSRQNPHDLKPLIMAGRNSGEASQAGALPMRKEHWEQD